MAFFVSHISWAPLSCKFESTVLIIDRFSSIFEGRGIKLGLWGVSITSGVNYNRTADSISDIPTGARIPYLLIAGKPSISLELTPRKTILFVQRGMAKGIELESMDQAVERIKKRLSTKKKRTVYLIR